MFPGDPDGTPTQALAHYIDSVLLPMADYVLDLHSGGSSLMYLPTVILGGERMTPAVRQEKLEVGRAFGAPYTFLFPDGQGSNATTAAATANRGAIWIGTEMGGSGTVTRECLRICEGGTHRVLRHLGVWRGAVSTDEAPAVASRLLTAHSWDYFTYAPEDGLFEPRAELGDEVEAGQLAGFMHEPATPGLAPVPVHFEVAGLVVCTRVPGRTERGDCLFHNERRDQRRGEDGHIERFARLDTPGQRSGGTELQVQTAADGLFDLGKGLLNHSLDAV